jgi:hypothetical protein
MTRRREFPDVSETKWEAMNRKQHGNSKDLKRPGTQNVQSPKTHSTGGKTFGQKIIQQLTLQITKLQQENV